MVRRFVLIAFLEDRGNIPVSPIQGGVSGIKWMLKYFS